MLAALSTSIPSPTQGVWRIGGFPIRGYAMCILLGIVLATWIAERRWRARGGPPGIGLDVATYGVPAGVVGARIYHVVTTSAPYFGKGGHPIDALKIWDGGLGIWGGIAAGCLGGWYACRRRGVSFAMFADCAAPGVAVAQACGRWGNWFNNELYGRPTHLPWGLTIYQWDDTGGHAVRNASGHAVVLGTFQPTFLYESLWCLGAAGALLILERRFSLDRGRTFAAYVMLYTAGRAWIEYLRVDSAVHILGIRLNDWTALIVFLGGLAYLLTMNRKVAKEKLTGSAPDGHPDGDPEGSGPPGEGGDPSPDSAAGVAADELSQDADATSAPRDEAAR